MFKDVFKKYGQLIIVFILLLIVYLCLTNIPAISSFMGNLFSVLSPFLLGLLFALLLLVPCRGTEKLLNKSKFKFLRKHKRGISVISCYLIVFILISLLVKFAIPTISDNVSELVANIPIFYNNFVNTINTLPEDSIFYGIDFNFILDNISIENIQTFLNFDTIWASVKGVINVASAVFSLFVAVILSVYILFDKEKIMGFIARFLKVTFGTKTEKNVTTYLHKITVIFSKFINAQFLDAIVVGTFSTIVLLILKVKYALILGPLIGIANMIPYFGAIFATIFAIIITLFTGGFWQALSVFIFILVLQQIDANIINPKILSDNLKMSPLLVILAVTIGGGFFGVIGMFLGVPILATIKAIVIDYVEYKENKQEEIS